MLPHASGQESHLRRIGSPCTRSRRCSARSRSRRQRRHQPGPARNEPRAATVAATKGGSTRPARLRQGEGMATSSGRGFARRPPPRPELANALASWPIQGLRLANERGGHDRGAARRDWRYQRTRDALREARARPEPSEPLRSRARSRRPKPARACCCRRSRSRRYTAVHNPQLRARRGQGTPRQRRARAARADFVGPRVERLAQLPPSGRCASRTRGSPATNSGAVG